MRKKLSLFLVLMVAALFLFGALAVYSASAMPNLSPDGKTCTPCHTDKGDAAKPAEPAKSPAPAKEAQDKAAPAPAKAAPAKAATAPKANTGVNITAFGKTTPVAGKASGKTLLVPLRKVADLFYAALDWDAKSKTATVLYRDKKATLSGSKALLNDQELSLDAKPQNISGSIYVPVSFVNQVFGAEATGDLSKGIAINAALPGYAGASTCGKCHQERYKDWQNTRHAEMLQDASDPNAWVLGNFATNTFFKREDVAFLVGNGMEGGQRYVAAQDGKLMYMAATWDQESHSWKKANPSAYTCAGCHTAGFNPQSGSWAENGITCESCHGPGAEHAKAPSKANIKNGVGTDMCSSCHGADRQKEQMEKAAKASPNGSHLGIFASASVAEADRYWPSKCFRCHSAAYKVAEAKGKPLPTAEDYQTGALKNERNGITCVICHDPHKNAGNEFQLRKDPTETCLQCHTNSSGAPKKGSESHHSQLQTWQGLVYTGDSDKPITITAPKKITCADCHMTDGNHMFKVGTPKITLTSHGKPYEADSCAKCHGSMTEKEIKETQEGFAKQYQDFKAKLKAAGEKLDAAKKASKDVSKAQPYYDASVTNLALFASDGSEGIHSVPWAKAIFSQVEKDLAKFNTLLP